MGLIINYEIFKFINLILRFDNYISYFEVKNLNVVSLLY